MRPIHAMSHTFSSGPKIIQSIPVAQQTKTIPTEYGIPTMGDSAFDMVDGRMMDIPAMDSMEDASLLHPAHTEKSESVLGRYKKQAENPMPKKPSSQAKDVVSPEKKFDRAASMVRHEERKDPSSEATLKAYQKYDNRSSPQGYENGVPQGNGPRKVVGHNHAKDGKAPEWQPDSPNHEELNGMHKNLESKGFTHSHSGSRAGFKGLISHTYKNKEGKVGYVNERKSGVHTYHDEGQP